MSILLYAILAYLLYLFIFRLVIPVYITTRKIKKGFREMQSKMQEQAKKQQGFSDQTQDGSKPKVKPKQEDYIDFEEVK